MDRIITDINTRIAQELSAYDKPIMIGGLTEPVIVRDEAEQSWPAIIDDTGECNVNLFDDKYRIGIYHKLTKITYQENAVKGYGDKKQIQQVADMSLIAYGDRGTADPYALAETLRKELTKTKKNGKEICSVTDATFNRVQVFAGEFGGIEFFLQPHVFLFRINYRLVTALPECINHQQK